MKHCIKLLLIITALPIWQAVASEVPRDAWGSPTNYIQMAITLKGGGNRIENGKAVELLIHLKNVSSNETFRIFKAIGPVQGDGSYLVTILTPSGKEISPHQISMYVPSLKGDVVDLHPKQGMELDFDLSNFVKFDEAGLYRIVLRKEIRSPHTGKRFLVTAAPITISIEKRSD